jgi:hypothetical protein
MSYLSYAIVQKKKQATHEAAHKDSICFTCGASSEKKVTLVQRVSQSKILFGAVPEEGLEVEHMAQDKNRNETN